jgi:hypothetical protein
MWKMLIRLLSRKKKNWPEIKVKGAKVRVKVEAKQLPRTWYKSPVGSQLIFLFLLKNAAYTSCLVNEKSSSRQLQFDFDLIFTTKSVKIPFSSFGL